MILLYNIFILFFQTIIRIASVWNDKARQWVEGRKNTWQPLEQRISTEKPVIWVHAASAGESEQAKPIIEALKLAYPVYQIWVSFFSPSGYNAAKKYEHAEHIFYLPIDTPVNAKRLIETLKPGLVIFVKYEFWYHYLKAVHQNQIPLLLVSSTFRKDQPFFKWYGNFYRKMLLFFTQIFAQDISSLTLLQKHGIVQSQLSGDTRFDRVAMIASNFTELPLIKKFVGDNQVLVTGSTWPGDEAILKGVIQSFPKIKLIIAPHEIDRGHIEAMKMQFFNATLYSQLSDSSEDFQSNVLIIDNVGMLSRLYYYGTVTYVGGGFTRDGIHNILEAAVFGKPVFFGPNYKKYREADELINYGGAFSITTADELRDRIKNLLTNPISYTQSCEASIKYIADKKGATKKILNYIQEKRLLTN